MKAARLCAILQDPAIEMRGRAALIVSESGIATGPELEPAFMVALRSGAVDRYAAATLLAHIHQIEPAECAEWRNDARLAELRAEVAALTAEAERATAAEPEKGRLQQQIASLTQLADSKRLDLAALKDTVAGHEQTLREIDGERGEEAP